ncbi:hypothetical protein HUJ05_011384 [Dendroctonus ponderosae]|nr:hypothetical protein HUJ05_011384 [Dendroctonus ponderosae]
MKSKVFSIRPHSYELAFDASPHLHLQAGEFLHSLAFIESEVPFEERQDFVDIDLSAQLFRILSLVRDPFLKQSSPKKASRSTGLQSTCPSNTNLGSISHKKAVSLVPRLTAKQSSRSLIPFN